MASVMADNLEEHFGCSVCLEKFNNPRVLSCLHTFCERCLERLVEHKGEKWLVKCPECRKYTEVPEGDVQNLKANFFINNLMSSVELHKEKQKNIECDDCANEDPPVVRCLTCCQFLCEFCSQAHRRRNLTKCHKLMSLEELKSCGPAALSKPAICKVHESEPIKLYCQSCETTICRDCTMIDHREHQYKFVKDVYSEEKAAVNQLLGETKAKQNVLQDALKGVVEMKTRVQGAGERVAQQINTSVDSLIQALEDRRNNLLQQAGEIEQGKLKGLQVQQEELELDLSTITSSVEFTEKALRDGSQVEVLSMKKQMTERLRELNTVTRPLNPCTDDVICYKVKIVNADVINWLGDVVDYGTSPEKCVMKIDALKVGKETTMKIFAKDQHGRPTESGGDDVSVEIKTPSNRNIESSDTDSETQKIEVTDNDNGTYQASVIARVPGVHRVFVKVNGSEIQESPFDWNVKGNANVQMSTLQMEAGEAGVIYNTLINQTREFTIITVGDGEEIREESNEISVQIKNPRTFEDIPVQYRGNGSYTFSYKPSSTGNYQVTVKVNGDDIPGSPFTWEVEQWHLKGREKTNKGFKFSQDNMTIHYTGGWGFIIGSCGFAAGCHSWKVKVVSGKIFRVGVTDSDVSSAIQQSTWYWENGSRHHKCNGKDQSGSKQPSNITQFSAGDVCIAFLNIDKKQLTVHHLPSGQTDSWEDVCVPNSKMFPSYSLYNGFEITLLM